MICTELLAAPVWDSATQKLVGMLTVVTFIEVLLHFCDENGVVSSDVGSHTIRQWMGESICKV